MDTGARSISLALMVFLYFFKPPPHFMWYRLWQNSICLAPLRHCTSFSQKEILSIADYLKAFVLTRGVVMLLMLLLVFPFPSPINMKSKNGYYR